MSARNNGKSDLEMKEEYHGLVEHLSLRLLIGMMPSDYDWMWRKIGRLAARHPELLKTSSPVLSVTWKKEMECETAFSHSGEYWQRVKELSLRLLTGAAPASVDPEWKMIRRAAMRNPDWLVDDNKPISIGFVPEEDEWDEEEYEDFLDAVGDSQWEDEMDLDVNSDGEGEMVGDRG